MVFHRVAQQVANRHQATFGLSHLPNVCLIGIGTVCEIQQFIQCIGTAYADQAIP